MINCPKCGKKISEFVVNCPHCGNANIINGNDTLKVAKLSKKQRANSRKKIIVYVCIALTALRLFREINDYLFYWRFGIINIVFCLTSAILGVGISLICLRLIKRNNEWKMIDTIVLLISFLKAAIFIANSILIYGGIYTGIPYSGYIENDTFQRGNVVSVCLSFIPMILIALLMIKKEDI